MQISLNRQLKAPIYQQIKNQIIRQILSGELAAGEVLPSERVLADYLGVNRSTVNKAYWELKAEGFVDAVMGSGTIINQQFTRTHTAKDAYVPPMPWNQLMNRPHLLTGNSIIKTALEAITEDNTISFAGGFAGDDVLPTATVEHLLPLCMKKYGEKLLHPTPLLGLDALRTSICKCARPSVTTAQCMITSGAQQGISYIAELFLSPGDMVFTAAPSYVGAIEIFKAHGAKVVGIPVDQFGMGIDILENYLIRYRPKLIYVNPNFQNPTGTYMPLERRLKLLDLAYLYQIPIIEDDPYSEIYYEPIDVPSLKALDQHQYVIYLSTFSKQFFMGGRIGWVFAAEEIIERLGVLKQVTDLHANTLHQYMMLEALQSGLISEHLTKLRASVYAKQRIMIEAFEAHPIEGLTFEIPKGGFYLWVKLPQTINAHQFFEACKSRHVAVMPGDPFFPQATADSTYIRVNYSYPTHEDIQEGVHRLIDAIKAAQAVAPKPTKVPYNQIIL